MGRDARRKKTIFTPIKVADIKVNFFVKPKPMWPKVGNSCDKEEFLLRYFFIVRNNSARKCLGTNDNRRINDVKKLVHLAEVYDIHPALQGQQAS